VVFRGGPQRHPDRAVVLARVFSNTVAIEPGANYAAVSARIWRRQSVRPEVF